MMMSGLVPKRLIAVVAALVVLGGIACGIAGVQQPTAATPTRGADRGGGPRGQFGDGGTQTSGAPGGVGFGQNLDAAAQVMGLSVDQVRQEAAGSTLTAVAQAHRVDPATVAAALKTSAAAGIDRATSDGRITADQAAQMQA